MSNFWPTDIDLGDTQSPIRILYDAQSDWEANSGGDLALVLQNTQSKSGNSMIIVHAKHVPSNRTGTLFSVIHRLNSPYPVTIIPNDGDMPNCLRKSYYQPGFDGLSAITTAAALGFSKTKGKTVENEWVADTPSGFRDKLTEVFNFGFVKSIVLNLSASDSGGEDADESPTEESATEDVG